MTVAVCWKCDGDVGGRLPQGTPRQSADPRNATEARRGGRGVPDEFARLFERLTA